MDGDTVTQKKMLHQLFQKLVIVRRTIELLRTIPQVRCSIDVLIEKIQEWLPNENPHLVANVLISWGRFAEVFGYSDDTKEIYLDVGQEVT